MRFLLCLLVLLPCAASWPARAAGPEALQHALEVVFQTTPQSPGMIAAVDQPGVAWSAAVGVRDRATQEPLQTGDTFRIASVTKPFTAAAVLRLVEEKKLRLKDRLDAVLPADQIALLRDDGYRTDRITVRMLLQHTAGLFDYASSDAYLAAVAADFTHRWTRIEQLRFAMEHGDPLAKPGRAFHYSDTGYILLGEIIERVTGLPQAQAYRELLRFDTLGLTSTWFESLEPVPPGAGPRAHQYLGDSDTVDLDPSHDLYGGGGLVSSVGDQLRFFEALLGGRVLGKRALRQMLRPSSASDGRYGMGIARADAGTAGICWGHDGFWGAATLVCPRRGIAVSVTVNAGPPVDPGRLLAWILSAAASD